MKDKNSEWYKIMTGLASDAYLRYNKLPAGTYDIKGVTDNYTNYERKGSLHFSSNAWAMTEAIVWN